MRARLHLRLIGALLVPALVASGAAQGMLLIRCGTTTRMSCCCPKEPPPPAGATVRAEKRQCCAVAAIPQGSKGAMRDQAVPAFDPPVLVAIAGQQAASGPFVDRAWPVPRLDPPLARSLALANCALLI